MWPANGRTYLLPGVGARDAITSKKRFMLSYWILLIAFGNIALQNDWFCCNESFIADIIQRQNRAEQNPPPMSYPFTPLHKLPLLSFLCPFLLSLLSILDLILYHPYLLLPISSNIYCPYYLLPTSLNDEIEPGRAPVPRATPSPRISQQVTRLNSTR